MPPTYHEVYDRWRSAPEAFWAEAAEAVHWYRRWDAVLDASRAPFYRWLIFMTQTNYRAKGLA